MFQFSGALTDLSLTFIFSDLSSEAKDLITQLLKKVHF